ncbi:MAG: 4-hydroxy-tetrahydrodipicolinate synthase [Promethearchaeati archaeon SRVP18_Atabeyarchaeia-1]
MKVEGCVTPVVTPFDSEEEVDEESLKEIVDYLVDGGASGLFAAGTAGAFYLMTPEERKRVTSIVVEKSNGRVPVYAGTGGITVRENLDIAKHAKDVGADAAVILTPYYVKVEDEELFQYFTTFANAVDMEVILYNNPSRAGNNISPALLERIVNENSNVIALKDSSGDLAQYGEYVMRMKDKISLVSGKDELMLASLAMGGNGVVSAVSNIVPELVSQIFASFERGDIRKAQEIQSKCSTLKKSFGGAAYPAPILAALDLLGMRAGRPRSPVLPLKNEQKENIRQALKSIGKLH